MVPDRMGVESALPTGRKRLRIKPRLLLNGLLGPKVIQEVEIKIVRGWMNPYRHDKTEEFVWMREARSHREIIVSV